MIDTLLQHLPAARALDLPGRLGLRRGEYVVSTLHRPSNVDEPERLAVLVQALTRVSQELPGGPAAPSAHPREAGAIRTRVAGGVLRLLEPLGYTEMISLIDGSAVVLTDSGGLQEETTALGVPCVTLREQTERPVTITEGTNRMAPWPLTVEGILGAFREARALGRAAPGEHRPEGWDGEAGRRIAAALAAAGSR